MLGMSETPHTLTSRKNNMAEKIVYSLFIKIGNINIIYKDVWMRYSFV